MATFQREEIMLASLHTATAPTVYNYEVILGRKSTSVSEGIGNRLKIELTFKKLNLWLTAKQDSEANICTQEE